MARGRASYCVPMFRPLRRAGAGLLCLQLIALLVFSTIQYRRFALTTDFAFYNQALWKISHGQLYPFSTVSGISAWRDNAECILWPLGLLYRISPHPIELLWLQDACLVLTEWFTFQWVLEVLVSRDQGLSYRARTYFAGLALAALVFDPWAYETIAFDFHSHVIVALFVVLAGRNLWCDRLKMFSFWSVLAILASAEGALYVIGLGIFGLARSRRGRVLSGGVAIVAACWFLLVSVIGADGGAGHGLSTGYGYLAGGHHGSDLVAISIGAIRHPDLLLHMLYSRVGLVALLLLGAGLVGVASRLAAGMCLVVFLPAALNADAAYLRIEQSFQVWVALPFVLVGSVRLITRYWEGTQITRRVGVSVSCATMTAMAVLAYGAIPLVPRYWIAVDARAASVLDQVHRWVPSGAEVVASNGLVGRFAARDYVYVLGYDPHKHALEESFSEVPATTHTVVFIISSRQGVGESEALNVRLIAALRDSPQASILKRAAGIIVVEWRPPLDHATRELHW